LSSAFEEDDIAKHVALGKDTGRVQFCLATNDLASNKEAKPGFTSSSIDFHKWLAD